MFKLQKGDMAGTVSKKEGELTFEVFSKAIEELSLAPPPLDYVLLRPSTFKALKEDNKLDKIGDDYYLCGTKVKEVPKLKQEYHLVY